MFPWRRPRDNWLQDLIRSLESLLFTPAHSDAPLADSPRAKGTRAENLACEHLRRQGYRILERNWTCPRGELDIIASRDGRLVITEVKSGKADAHFRPSMHINPAKQRQLWKLTEQYLKKHRLLGTAVQLDVIEVIYEPDGSHRLEHLQSAVPDIRNWR
ncbi:MAG: YraN family protein [Armatimonadia bacterium]